MVRIFGVDFSSENNNVALRNKSGGGAYSRDDASSCSLPNDHYGFEFLAKDFKKLCLNEEKVMGGSNPNIGVTLKGKIKVVKSEQVQKHEFSAPSMTFSCIICWKQFPSKRSLGGHKRAHKAKHENHPQENNNKVVSSSPTLREHQNSHKREREIHGQENHNNYKKVVTMKGKEVVKSEQRQPSDFVKLIPIIDLTNNDPICGLMKVEENDIITPSKTFPCKICKREFSSARALGGHVKVHKRKLKHPQEMENFSIKLEDNVGESSRRDYHHTIKEEPFELDLSLKL